MNRAQSGELGSIGVSARIDLRTGEIRLVPTSQLRGPFLGGRGAGQYLVFREVAPSVSPLDPENLLVFGAGPLVGTLAPASSRASVDTKGLTTGGVSSSNVGGHWAPELKYAGFDMLVIQGKAEKPVYLLIENGRISIRDASSLWGLTTWETEEYLRRQMADERLQLLSIGPAGERMSPISCIMVDRARAAGHGGCGAVMGSKNLKAIACRGNMPISIASPGAFNDAVRRSEAKLSGSKGVSLSREGGTLLRSGCGGFDGKRPTTVRNSQDESWSPEKVALIREAVFRERFEVARLACFNCSMYCSHYYRVEQGIYDGLRCEGVQSNAARGFGSNIDVTDPAAILKANALCNAYGLDVDGAANMLAWSFELYEKGILTSADTDGLMLRWEDHQAMVTLLERICRGEGVGNLLGQGAKRGSAMLGRGSAYYGLTNKGHDLNESALRSHKAWALGVFTSTRGGGHLNGAPSTEFQRVSPEVSMQLFGVPTAGVPEVYEGKPEILVYFERLKAIVDSLGLCYFGSQWIETTLMDARDYADLYSSATGNELIAEDLMVQGEKLVNLERWFNFLHCGYGRQEDYPPERLMLEPIQSGPWAGHLIDRERWDSTLDRYYSLHGWDLKTGVPSVERLMKMGLLDV